MTFPVHSSHAQFREEKRKHATDIRNSPRREGYRSRTPHPYEPDQPQAPHWSQEDFSSEKRVHLTDIRCSPNRTGRSPRPPRGTCEHVDSPGQHGSHREFSIEKTEHVAPILPLRPKPKEEPRDPYTFKHKLHSELAGEKQGHKTMIFPLVPPDPTDRPTVDNYLNYRPHEEGFLHSSCRRLTKEKKGHLTSIHTSPRKVVERAPTPEESPARYGLHVSNVTLNSEKKRHVRDLQASPRRSRSAEPRRSQSPEGCYYSHSEFTGVKSKHRTPINPEPDAASLRSVSRSPNRPPYSSHTHYYADKMRHAADTTASVRSRSHDPRPRTCVHDFHLSHGTFESEKMKHLTDIRTSPRRQPPKERQSHKGFTSRAELAKAKRGHKVSLGDAPPPPPVDKRQHLSNSNFTHEKRKHRTDILPHSTPRERPRMEPPLPPHESHFEFSSEKRIHATEIRNSPRRETSRSPSRSPNRLMSQSHLAYDKRRHTLELDSPCRQRGPYSHDGTPGRFSRGSSVHSHDDRPADTPPSYHEHQAGARTPLSSVRSEKGDTQTPTYAAGMRSRTPDRTPTGTPLSRSRSQGSYGAPSYPPSEQSVERRSRPPSVVSTPRTPQ